MSAEKGIVEAKTILVGINDTDCGRFHHGSNNSIQHSTTLGFVFHGANLFLQIFKVPLGISAMAFPLVALVASNHRSTQTARLIKLQNSQNIFANHYTHMDKFTEYCKDLAAYQNVKFLNPRALHSFLYPNSREGDYSLNALFVHQFCGKNKTLFEEASKIYERHSMHSNRHDEEDIDDEMLAIFDYFCNGAIDLMVFVQHYFSVPDFPQGKLSDLVSSLDAITELLKNIIQFDGSTTKSFQTDNFYSLGFVMSFGVDLSLQRYKERFNIMNKLTPIG